ncbi:MAG: TfoX/Sxy family protein [Parahaliea sp.]
MSASEFVEYLHEVFALFGPIQSRRMFGGYGIYRDGLMFALVADEALYLKTDAETVNCFTELGLSPFEYDKGDKKVQMSYYAASEAIFDEPEQAKEWADRAFGAALRAKKKTDTKRR